MNAFVLGIDGCRSGWLACRLHAGADAFSFHLYSTFAQLLSAERNAVRIAVDIPIGLKGDWTARQCDQMARNLLGKRSSSIFPAPPRPLLSEKSFASALARSREAFQKGLSQQTFHILHKVREVDVAIAGAPHGKLSEVHPELCFHSAAGRPLLHSKKSKNGFEERRALLREICQLHLPEHHRWRADLGLRGKGVSGDDVLDAAIAAATALRSLRREARTIPAEPERDALGIPMQILYW